MGDISGKGISAALLMATIGSAVRAYQPVAAALREDAALLWRGRSTPEEASARNEGTLALALIPELVAAGFEPQGRMTGTPRRS